MKTWKKLLGIIVAGLILFTAVSSASATIVPLASEGINVDDWNGYTFVVFECVDKIVDGIEDGELAIINSIHKRPGPDAEKTRYSPDGISIRPFTLKEIGEKSDMLFSVDIPELKKDNTVAPDFHLPEIKNIKNQ